MFVRRVLLRSTKSTTTAQSRADKGTSAAGNGWGTANLALQLDRGEGGPADHPWAAKLLLQAAKAGNGVRLKDLRGDLIGWAAASRTELKRELARLGHYTGTVDATWDAAARAAL